MISPMTCYHGKISVNVPDDSGQLVTMHGFSAEVYRKKHCTVHLYSISIGLVIQWERKV